MTERTIRMPKGGPRRVQHTRSIHQDVALEGETRKVMPVKHYSHQMVLYEKDGQTKAGCLCGWRSLVHSKDSFISWWTHATRAVNEEHRRG
jgi:hypothetical protein